MKKILFLSITIIITLLTSCSSEDIFTPFAEGGDGNITFTATIPAATSASRALGEPTTESLQSLKLLVFDKNGLLQEIRTATAINPTGETQGMYTVALTASSEKRIIHFVANYSGDITYGASENAVLSKLSVSGDNDAYWQRMVVNSIKENADLGTVALVRNFARVTVTSSDADFTYEGFVLVNTATRGTVAPYKTIASGGFATYTEDVTYETLAAEYKGIEPANVEINKNIPTDFNDNKKYLYERTQVKDPVCIIVKGQYGSNRSSYYKVDIINKKEGEADEYYKIFRNFSYDIVINNVAGEGYESPEIAMQHAASNNLSASIDLQNLLNLSDGKDRLFVSTTDTTLVNNNVIEIRYRLWRDLTSKTIANEDVDFLYFEQGKPDVVIELFECTKTKWNTDGYTTISITPKSYSGSQKLEQTITLKDKRSGLSRSIKLTLRKPYEYQSVTCTTPGSDQSLTFAFTLPDLPPSLFPMTFVVEAKNHTIYPDKNSDIKMPVVLLGGSFGYERTVTWEEYTDKKGVIDCPFKTNTEDYDSEITVNNKYFINGSTEIGSVKGFNDIVINSGNDVPYGQQNITFAFEMKTTTKVTINAPQMASATTNSGSITEQNGTFTYTPANAGVQTITFTTNNFASAGTISLSANNYMDAQQEYRNTIYAAKTKLKANISLSDVGIYLDEVGNDNIGSCSFSSGYTLSNDMNIPKADLNEKTTLYFRGTSKRSKLRKAQITLGKLLDGNTNTLIFTDENGNTIREFTEFKINDEKSVDCGKGKEVKIVFTMSDTESVTINAFNMGEAKQVPGFGTATGNNGIFTYTPTQVGEQQIILVTNNAVSAGDITLSANSYEEITGNYKNRLYVPKEMLFSNIEINSSSNSRNVAIYANDSYNTPIGNVYYKFQSKNSKYQLTTNINIDNVTLGTILYFKSGKSNNTKYASISVEELTNGAAHTLIFK